MLGLDEGVESIALATYELKEEETSINRAAPTLLGAVRTFHSKFNLEGAEELRLSPVIVDFRRLLKSTTSAQVVNGV